MERENQRIAITKRLLKESMLRLMKQKDADKISVTELCRDAGVNRATFYRHYEIPRDILGEIERDAYYAFRKRAGLPKSAADIKPCMDRMFAFAEENIDLLRLLIQNKNDVDFAQFINDIYLEIWNEVKDYPVFRRFSTEDMQLFALYSAGGSYFLLRHWVMGNIRKSAAEISDYVYGLMQKTDLQLLCGQIGME